MNFFIATKNDDGANWPIAWFGQDENGDHWSLNTDNVHASELDQYSCGAQGDAELVAELLNKYYAERQKV